jgi:hypothetical protein
MTRSAKNYCFTLNNYTPVDCDRLKSLFDTDDVKYLIYGREEGEAGTPHLQGYIQLNNRRTFNWIRSRLGGRAHIELAKGTPAQNRDYCSKDGSFEEFGEISGGRGARTDLVAFAEAIRSGDSDDKLLSDHPASFLKYQRGLHAARAATSPKRNWPSQVFVYWGATGTGKTKTAWEQSEQSAYIHVGQHWFDGYTGQESVIFDDFGGSEFKITYLLKLLDRYPMKVPIKGGFVEWLPKKIYITSNYHPQDWYQNAKPEHVLALLRRLTIIQEFPNPE